MIGLIFKQHLLLYFKLLLVKVQQRSVCRKYSSFIQNIYQGFKELEYVDLLRDLQRIATCKDSKNYNMQIYNLIYKELQLEKW